MAQILALGSLLEKRFALTVEGFRTGGGFSMTLPYATGSRPMKANLHGMLQRKLI